MIKPMDELYEILKQIIDDECDNRNFKEYLRNKFVSKQLNGGTPNLILGENIPLPDCEDVDLICFAEGCKEYFNLEALELSSYFGVDALSRYRTYINPEEQLTVIEVDNVIRDKKNPNRFIAGFVPLEKFPMWEKHKLTRYNFDTQRDPIYKKLSNGRAIRRRNIDEQSVNDIDNSMYNDEFQPNMVTYNILICPGKKPNYNYDEKTLKLTIKPNLNYDDDDFTVVDIVDGQHRITGASRAVARAIKNNKELAGSLHACFYMMTLEEAKAYIETQAKQNVMSKEYTESLKTDDYTTFVDKITSWKNSKNNILQNEVANTFDEMKVYEKLTYKTALTEACKMTRIDVADNVEKKFASEKFAEIINTLINYMKKEFYNNDIEDMKNERIFLAPNIFIGYIAIAELLWKEKDYVDKLIDIVVLLQTEKVKTELSSMKLNHRSLETIKKNIFKYFQELVRSLENEEEVI